MLRCDVSARTASTAFERVCFEHVALAELALSEIDLSTKFLNRPLLAPLLMNSMTGGPSRAYAINHAIATAEQASRIAFVVGSQRIALEGKATSGFGRHVRDVAPDVPIMGNLGAAQPIGWKGIDMACRATDMIGAGALIIHLHPLQEDSTGFRRAQSAWYLTSTMEAAFCVEAPKDGLARYGKPIIFNTDHGAQSTGPAFTGVLARSVMRLWKPRPYSLIVAEEYPLPAWED